MMEESYWELRRKREYQEKLAEEKKEKERNNDNKI